MRISTRLLLGFVLLVVGSMAVLGVLLIRKSQDAIATSILRDYQEIATRAAGEVETFLEKPMQLLSATAGVLSLSYADPWKQESVLIKLRLQFPIFGTLQLTDTDGKGRVTSDPGTTPRDWSGEHAFRTAVAGKSFISPVLFSEGQVPYTYMSVPVVWRGKIRGALLAKVNMQGLWDLVDSIRIGKTGRAYVVSSEGTIIAHPDKKMALRGKRYKGVQVTKTGPSGEEYVDEKGKTWLRAYAPIPNVQWGIVVEQPAEEAYTFARAMKRQSLIVIGIGVGVALGIGIAFSQSVIRPIRKLVKGTLKIAQGDLDYKVEYAKKNEMGQLADSFNRMTSSLKETQRELLAEKAFSERILEHSPIGILTVDEGGYITIANAALQRLLGDAGEVVGKRILDIPLFKEMDLEHFLENGKLEGTLSSGPVRIGGKGRMFHIRKTSLDGDGMASFLLLMDDITEQKAMEHQLLQSEKLAGIGQLAAGVAHELRNPLSIIASSVHLLSRFLPKGNEKAEMALSTTRTSIERSSRIISNLLDFSRPSSHKREWIDIENLLNQVLLLEGKSISRQGIKVVPSFEGIPKIRAHLDAMRQTFLNLVANAVQAMPEGGTLSLGTSRGDQGTILVEVSDTGVGIHQEDLERIFEPFCGVRIP